MSILELFGIKKDAEPIDVIRSGKELKENIKTKNEAIENILNENPDLINNLNIDDDSTATGGITEIQPNAFSTINNSALSTPFGKLGIMDLVQAKNFFSNPSFLGGLSFFGPSFAPLAIGGLKSLFSNIKDPYKSAFGGLNRQTREAINRESVRDLQDRIDKGQFGSTTPTPQDARRGGQYDGSGGRTSGGFSSSERGAALHG